jgi:hypothetical protein
MVAKSCPPTQNTTTKHSTQHTQQPTCATATLLPVAFPSLSMATSPVDPNHGATAPHDESYSGFRCGGLIHAAPFPLYGAPKWHPSKKREKDGTSTLGGHHLMGEYNNQPEVGVGKEFEGGEMVRWAITKGWGVFPSFGGLNKQWKKIK